jgi:hypothetical protein
MFLLSISCAGTARVSSGDAYARSCTRRAARSLVAGIVVARGEERYTARTMLAYRRPRWVRGELYDGVGSLRASYLLEDGVLTVRLAGNGEIVSDEPDWSGWDELLGIPSGSSRLFGLLPLIIDPWSIADTGHSPPPEVTTTLDGGGTARIRFRDGRVSDLTLVDPDGTEATCTFEGGDGCLPAQRFTIDLPQHGVVVWISVEADADFPESAPLELVPGT